MNMLNRQGQDDDKSLNRSTKTFKSEEESKDQKQKSKHIMNSTKQDLNSRQYIQTSHSIKEISQKYIASSSKILSQTQDKIEQLTKKIYKKRKIAMALLFMASACSVNKESKPFYIMRLSYLLVKKATIIISQLAKLLRTGKGFDILIGQKIKETFTKSKQFLKINPIINKEMQMTQQKFQKIVEDLKSLTQLQKDKQLKEELSSQKINNDYLRKCSSEFLHELHLSYNSEYLNEYEKSHLIGIYLISLLSSYESYESSFEDLFSNNSSSFSNQLLVKQVSNFSKENILQFIELGIHDNYSKTETFTQNNLSKSNKSVF